MLDVELSKHAAARANQRGVSHHLLSTLLDVADIDSPVGSGCRLFRVSRQRLNDRATRRRVGSEADRLASLAVIWSDSTQTIVTVLHHDGRAGRRYRASH